VTRASAPSVTTRPLGANTPARSGWSRQIAVARSRSRYPAKSVEVDAVMTTHAVAPSAAASSINASTYTGGATASPSSARGRSRRRRPASRIASTTGAARARSRSWASAWSARSGRRAAAAATIGSDIAPTIPAASARGDVIASAAMSESVDKLAAAFRDALALGPEVDVTGLAYRAIPAWDSVAHMQLVAAIEATFDLMLDTDDVLALSSWAKACEIVAKHGVAL
jgi:acyl carrier protein